MTNVYGLFDTEAAASAVIQDIKELGVEESRISIVTPQSEKDVDQEAMLDATTGAGAGAIAGGLGGLLAGLGVFAVPGIGPVIGGGWLLATATGAAAGAMIGGAAGGLVEVLTEAGVPEQDANVYAESVRRGSTLLTATVPSHMVDAVSALLETRAVDLASRRDNYEAEGWTGFRT